jgi:hypothetical protein
MEHLTPFNWLLAGALFLLLCGVVGDRYAARNGLDREVWFFLGFLFGPIGLVLLARVSARGRWRDPGEPGSGHAAGEVGGREWREERSPRNLNPRAESYPYRLVPGVSLSSEQERTLRLNSSAD